MSIEEPERPTPEFDKALGSMDALIRSMREFAERDRGPTRYREHDHEPLAREKETREREAQVPEKEVREKETPSPEDQIQAKRQERLSQELQRNVQTREPMKYDSPERRQVIAAHLEKMKVAPELQAVRLLYEVGQAQPAEAGARPKPEMTGPGHARAVDAPTRARQEHERQERERENRERGREGR